MGEEFLAKVPPNKYYNKLLREAMLTLLIIIFWKSVTILAGIMYVENTSTAFALSKML